MVVWYHVVLFLLHLHMLQYKVCFSFFFFFNDTATTEIYTLSLHDALPISAPAGPRPPPPAPRARAPRPPAPTGDRKSTRLNSSHLVISYAVFCLKKKKNTATLLFYQTWPTRHTLSGSRYTHHSSPTRRCTA